MDNNVEKNNKELKCGAVGDSNYPFLFIYFDLDYINNSGSLTIALDGSQFEEFTYILEIIVNDKVLQSDILKSADIPIGKIKMELNNVRNILDSFKQNEECVHIRLRNDTSTDVKQALVYIYNPSQPTIRAVPQYGKIYNQGMGVVLFDYNMSLVTTPDTSVKLNNQELKFRQSNLFYQPYKQAETNMFDLNSLTGTNVIEINVLANQYRVNKRFENIKFQKIIGRYVGLELRRMIDLSFDVLVDTKIFPEKDQGIEVFTNGEFFPETIKEKDPITDKFKFNMVSKIGGPMSIKPKVVQPNKLVVGELDYYGFIDYKVDEASFKRDSDYGVLDFKLNVPVDLGLSQELTLTVNDLPYFFKKIDNFTYQCSIKFEHIKEHYNEVVLTIYDHKKEEVLYKGSLFFHDVK